MPAKIEGITGMRFGRLIIVSEAPPRMSGAQRVRFANVKCDCGAEKSTRFSDMMSGKTVSCGCHKAEQAAIRRTTHGQTSAGGRAPEYSSWANMHTRCENPNATHYDLYGARGIKVCGRWRSFEAFLADMGPKPTPGHSIDRINNDGNYEPGNCRWATDSEQMKNRRPYKYKRNR